jgi:translation elongation factor EF-1beta
VGQLSNPYNQGEKFNFTISGLPGELYEPDDDSPDETDASPAAPADSDEPVLGPERFADVVFELDTWSDIERSALSDRLREEGVPHWWVDTELHVAEADKAAVEELLGTVEEEVQELDPDREQVAYDISEWDDARLAALMRGLESADIAYGWDGVELYVYADDEEAADAIVDKISHPFELPEEEDDGDEAEDGGLLLGEVFVAADRLQHDARDRRSRKAMLRLAPRVEGAAAPYGLPAKDWDHLQERVTALATLLDESPKEQEAILTAARDLRVSLRPFV